MLGAAFAGEAGPCRGLPMRSQRPAGGARSEGDKSIPGAEPSALPPPGAATATTPEPLPELMGCDSCHQGPVHPGERGGRPGCQKKRPLRALEAGAGEPIARRSRVLPGAPAAGSSSRAAPDDHHEVDSPRQMQNSSCDASPALWPRSCPQVERGSHWKSRDQVSAAAWQQAAEGRQKTTRRRISQHPRSDTGHGQAQSKALLEDAISSTTVSFTHAETPVYKYTRSKLYTVRDEEHKSLVLQSHAGQALLVAVHLQGPKISEEVKLTLDLYRSPHRSPKRTNPVAMNIVENHLYLCCVLAGDSPVLQLEKVKGPMKEIRSGELERFIFFKSTSGSTSSFESAAHPGWFIGTSKANDKPVRMVNRTGEQDITDFSVLEV